MSRLNLILCKHDEMQLKTSMKRELDIGMSSYSNR